MNAGSFGLLQFLWPGSGVPAGHTDPANSVQAPQDWARSPAVRWLRRNTEGIWHFSEAAPMWVSRDDALHSDDVKGGIPNFGCPTNLC